MAVNREVTLPLDLWPCVLQKDRIVLEMHIPAGGGMTPAACAESFQRAVAFFRQHFPQASPAAIVSGSWIFSPVLEYFMPADANLVRFVRELYLFPVQSGLHDGLWFIFFQDKFDPATALRDTWLQRTMLDYITAGKRWRAGGMFMLLDDVPRFGTRVYRSRWPLSMIAK
jgi:hypothetical protein